MLIEGWAYTKRQKQLSQQYADRYLEIQKFRKCITGTRPTYARCDYRGTLPEDHGLSHKDILILCDRGNGCFGGNVVLDQHGNFNCSVYTD